MGPLTPIIGLRLLALAAGLRHNAEIGQPWLVFQRLRSQIRNQPSSGFAAVAGFARRGRNALGDRSAENHHGREAAGFLGGMAPGGVEPPHTDSKSVALSAELRGPAQRVADGTRTHDHLDHNQGLYRLSYRHRGQLRIAVSRPGGPGIPLSKCTSSSTKLPPALRMSVWSLDVLELRVPGDPRGLTRHAPGRIRTPDPRLRRPPLCPLSYRRREDRVSPCGASA